MKNQISDSILHLNYSNILFFTFGFISWLILTRLKNNRYHKIVESNINWYWFDIFRDTNNRVTREIKRNVQPARFPRLVVKFDYWMWRNQFIGWPRFATGRIIYSPPPLIAQPLSFETLIHTHTHTHTRARHNTRLAFLVIVKWYGTRFITSLTTLSRCKMEIRMSGVRLCNESISVIINFSSVVWIKDRSCDRSIL